MATSSSLLKRVWRAFFGSKPHAEVLLHDPKGSQAHDLDDPLFEKKLQERIGKAIADAAQKR
jgi:hypothetical protein